MRNHLAQEARRELLGLSSKLGKGTAIVRLHGLISDGVELDIGSVICVASQLIYEGRKSVVHQAIVIPYNKLTDRADELSKIAWLIGCNYAAYLGLHQVVQPVAFVCSPETPPTGLELVYVGQSDRSFFEKLTKGHG